MVYVLKINCKIRFGNAIGVHINFTVQFLDSLLNCLLDRHHFCMQLIKYCMLMCCTLFLMHCVVNILFSQQSVPTLFLVEMALITYMGTVICLHVIRPSSLAGIDITSFILPNFQQTPIRFMIPKRIHWEKSFFKYIEMFLKLGIPELEKLSECVAQVK